MLKVIISAHRHPSMTRAQFFAHLRDRHAPLVLGNSVYMQFLRQYIQNHAVLAEDGVVEGTRFRRATDRDSVIELWYDSVDSLLRANSEPQYLAQIRPDELSFNDQSNLVVLFTQPKQVFGAAGSAATCKAFDFVRKREDVSRQAFAQRLEEIGAALGADLAYRTHVCRLVHNLVIAGDESAFAPSANYDAVLETWSDSFANLAVASRLPTASSVPELVDPAASFSVFAWEVPIFVGIT